MADPWQRTALTTDNYMEVADLDRGTRYTVILVATTGTEEKSLETDSDSEIIKTAGQGEFIYYILILEDYLRRFNLEIIKIYR